MACTLPRPDEQPGFAQWTQINLGFGARCM
jgi:hypothetical protein